MSEAEVSKALLRLEELLNFQLVHPDKKSFPLNKDKEILKGIADSIIKVFLFLFFAS